MLIPISGEKTPPGLVKVPCFYANINKSQISKVLETLKKHTPPRSGDMQHIKRVQPCFVSPSKMSVLLAFSYQISKSDLQEILDFVPDLEISETQAAQYPARSKEEADEWCKQVWPLMWRGNVKAQPPTLTDIDSSKFHEILASFPIESSECSANCVIFDPQSQQILSESGSQEDVHVLKHSVMCAIEKIAENAKNSNLKDVYLCVGMDVLTSQEPCIMCCMALVHSRVGRLVFKAESPSEHSAIRYYKLHGRQQLNHTFEAWKYTDKEGEIK